MHVREKRRAASTLLVVAALVSVAVLSVVTAMGSENDQEEATEPSVDVTDITAAAGSDGDSTRGVPVTDTTTALAPEDSATRTSTPFHIIYPGHSVFGRVGYQFVYRSGFAHGGWKSMSSGP